MHGVGRVEGGGWFPFAIICIVTFEKILWNNFFCMAGQCHTKIMISQEIQI